MFVLKGVFYGFYHGTHHHEKKHHWRENMFGHFSKQQKSKIKISVGCITRVSFHLHLHTSLSTWGKTEFHFAYFATRDPEGIWNNGHEVLVEQVRRSLWDLQSSSWMGPKNWGAKRPGCSQSAGLAHVERPYRHRGSQLWPKQSAYHHLSRCRRGGAYTSLDSHGGRDVKSVWPARPAAPAAWTTTSERRYAPGPPPPTRPLVQVHWEWTSASGGPELQLIQCFAAGTTVHVEQRLCMGIRNTRQCEHYTLDLQDGPLLVSNGVITPINGLK